MERIEIIDGVPHTVVVAVVAHDDTTSYIQVCVPEGMDVDAVASQIALEDAADAGWDDAYIEDIEDALPEDALNTAHSTVHCV